SGREWAALPPLRPASAPAAPLTSGAPPVLPPLPGPRSVVSADIAPATGGVEGLARVHAAHAPGWPTTAAAAPAAAASPPPAAPGATTAVASLPAAAPAEPAGHVQVPLVYRAATAASPEDHPPLTAAIDEYVGEAREPAEQYRPPAWLRMSPPAWMVEPEADPLGAMAGMSIPSEPAPGGP